MRLYTARDWLYIQLVDREPVTMRSAGDRILLHLDRERAVVAVEILEAAPQKDRDRFTWSASAM